MTDTEHQESTPTLPEANAAKASKITVGERLKQGRETRGKSIKEAAREVNLPSNYVEALEADEFDKLPSDAFTRGYLRSYCRWLEIDEDEVLALYIMQSGRSESVELGVEFKPRQQTLRKSASSRKAAGSLLSVVLLVFGFWLFNNHFVNSPEAEPEQKTEGVLAEISVDTFSGKPLGDAGGFYSSETADGGQRASTSTSNQAGLENSFDVAAEADTDTVTAGQTTTVVKKQSVATKQKAATKQKVATKTTTTLNRGTGPDKLEFTFTGDCWLTIRNANGKKIYSNLRKAGQVLNLQGKAPFSIMIGNAKTVSVVFNGEAVLVKSRNKRNSVRLHLGEQ